MLAIFLAVLVIILLSLFFTYLSMKGYKYTPAGNLKYTLVLIKNPQAFNSQVLAQIYKLLAKKEAIFSIEKLQKNNSQAIVLFIPQFLKDNLDPSLNLLELEDYLSQANDFTQVKESHTYTFGLNLASKNQNLLIQEPLFSKLELGEQQQFYLQLSLLPQKNISGTFKTNVRAMVVEKDSHKKIELVKKVNELLKQSTNFLTDKPQPQRSETYFKEFKKRQLDNKKAIILSEDRLLEFLTKI